MDVAYYFLVLLALFAAEFSLNEFDQPHGLKYSREFLLQFHNADVAFDSETVIPLAIWRDYRNNADSKIFRTVRLRKRGRRGGVRQRDTAAVPYSSALCHTRQRSAIKEQNRRTSVECEVPF